MKSSPPSEKLESVYPETLVDLNVVDLFMFGSKNRKLFWVNLGFLGQLDFLSQRRKYGTSHTHTLIYIYIYVINHSEVDHIRTWDFQRHAVLAKVLLDMFIFYLQDDYICRILCRGRLHFSHGRLQCWWKNACGWTKWRSCRRGLVSQGII